MKCLHCHDYCYEILEETPEYLHIECLTCHTRYFRYIRMTIPQGHNTS